MKQNQNQDSGIEISDIFNVLWKKKFMIVSGTILFVCVWVLTDFILPKEYKVYSVIELGKRFVASADGKIIEEMPIEPPQSIKEKILGGIYDQAILEKFKDSLVELPKVDVLVPANTNMIKLTILSNKPKVAKNILNELVDSIIEGLMDKVNSEKNNLYNQIKILGIVRSSSLDMSILLQEQIKDTKNNISVLNADRKAALGKGADEKITALLYSTEIQDKQESLNKLEKLKNEMEKEYKIFTLRIEDINERLSKIKPTMFINAPNIPQKPLKRLSGLIFAFVIFLGFLLSAAFSFIIEYFDKARFKDSRKS
jgi:capsular polysaccharide biosynthesis protein